MTTTSPATTPLRTPPRPATWALKVTMAVTGSVWALFLLVHLFGNLKVYTGGSHFNGYAHWLRHAFEPLMPEEFVLWLLRIVLAVCLVLHVYAATTLFLRARRARGKFRTRRVRRAGLASLSARLMPVTGVFILAFLVTHLLDLTIGTKPIAPESFAGHDAAQSFAYENLVASFSRWWMAVIYVGTMLLLALHVAHGGRTLATDLGAIGNRLRAAFVWAGALAAIAILLGNASIPIAVQMRWLA